MQDGNEDSQAPVVQSEQASGVVPQGDMTTVGKEDVLDLSAMAINAIPSDLLGPSSQAPLS